MAAKPRIHEVARELGIDSKKALQMLRRLGEYPKSPSSTIEPPVARKLRAAVLAENAPTTREPESQHPEAIAARVRRHIVQRSDSDWEQYGFSPQEKATWRAAGVPAYKAHIAAMCRDSEKRGSNPSRLSPDALSHRLGTDTGAQTVLEALLDGSNYLRVQERLASRLGVEITGVNADLLRLTTSAQLLPERTSQELGSELARIDWEPRTSVSIADAVVEVLASFVPAVRTQIAIRQQIETYRSERTVAPLLAAFARVHGVMHTGELLDELCDGVAGVASDWVDALDAINLIERAVASRRFHFLRTDAVSELADRQVLSVAVDVLPPSPDGVALLLSPDEDKIRKEFVFWETGSSGVTRCIAIRASAFTAMKMYKLLNMKNSVETWEPDTLHTSEKVAASFLDRFSVRRSRPLGQANSNGSAARSSGVGTSSYSSPELRDIIVTYYPRNASTEPGAPTKRRNAPDHRWVVRGHWRRQWYRSDKEHRLIWIDEHQSGAADHPLLIAERVEVH